MQKKSLLRVLEDHNVQAYLQKTTSFFSLCTLFAKSFPLHLHVSWQLVNENNLQLKPLIKKIKR